jgi:hypothetical protein
MAAVLQQEKCGFAIKPSNQAMVAAVAEGDARELLQGERFPAGSVC